MDFTAAIIAAEKPSPPPSVPIEFTRKPSGEVQFKGVPSPDIIQQLITSSDYQAQGDRHHQQEIATLNAQSADRINLLTICFLGASFIVTIICFFWSYNAKEPPNNVDRGFIRGDVCR